MAHFDLSNYATVADRITQFWADHPDGRIETQMIHISESGKQFVVHAFIYAHKDDDKPVATGLAEEHFMDRGPNETSPIENCETSAIGRALVNWKYSSNASDRPSREEMDKVNRGQAIGNVEGAQRAKAAATGKTAVESDNRWATIKEGAAADPGNDFLRDLVKKGGQYGSLSEKQLGAGFNAARKALDAGNKRAGNVVQAFPGATELQPGEEPF